MNNHKKIYDIDISFVNVNGERNFKSIHNARISENNEININNNLIPMYWLDIYDQKGTFYDSIYNIDILGYRIRNKNQLPQVVSYNVE